MRLLTSSLIYLLSYTLSIGQQYEYEVQLNPISLQELGGLQSYSFGTSGNEWLIIGGRLDGLHQRQPFASFDPQGNNTSIIVVNPITKEIWKQSVLSLPLSLREQLTSTNMQFYQDGDHLLLTGGYAFSPSNNTHVTFPFLTIVDIPSLISQVKSSSLNESAFKQIENPQFQVCGGRLDKLGDTYFLVGGHKFMGRYNPMGPTHGPGFEQEYTNEVRRFNLSIDEQISVNWLPSFHDEIHLHRRDYNLLPFIKDNEKQLMLYSGVFQQNADVPFLYPVLISQNEHQAIESFSQHFNHYHCASLAIFNSEVAEMHTLFFGGIAQFYTKDGLLVQDNDIPFVNTIADVFQSNNGSLNEYILNSTMPGFLGAGSEFIFSAEASQFIEGVLDGDLIQDTFSRVGFIYGGIQSSAANIFWSNTGVESKATDVIYEVQLRKRNISTDKTPFAEERRILIYPNPAQDFIRLTVDLQKSTKVEVDIYTLDGKLIEQYIFPKEETNSGKNYLVLENDNINYRAYIYKISFDNQTFTRKVVWTE